VCVKGSLGCICSPSGLSVTSGDAGVQFNIAYVLLAQIGGIPVRDSEKGQNLRPVSSI